MKDILTVHNKTCQWKHINQQWLLVKKQLFALSHAACCQHDSAISHVPIALL